MTKPVVLVLTDGSILRGEVIGADDQTVGEVVFNIAVTGHQKILTDPSYAQQIATLTHPRIGNTGAAPEDVKVNRVWTTGLIIRSLPLTASNWRSRQSLPDYLKANGIVTVAGVDTRRLARIPREKGSQNGYILISADVTEERALELARVFPSLKDMDLAKEITTAECYEQRFSVWNLENDSHLEIPADELSYHVMACDYGVKLSILRILVARGCRLIAAPAQIPASEVLALNPDDIFLSNGPGDPEPCDYAVQTIREFFDIKIPVFGICLDHRLLALASGAKTPKMSYGYHSANHPIQDLDSGVVMIASQNYGFAVDKSTLLDSLRIVHKSPLGGTLQGIERADKATFSFQGRSEANPGPHDVAPLFNRFISAVTERR